MNIQDTCPCGGQWIVVGYGKDRRKFCDKCNHSEPDILRDVVEEWFEGYEQVRSSS